MTFKEIAEMRLGELGLGAVEAATSAGVPRDIVRDLLRRDSGDLRASSIPKLAAALRLDADALARREVVRLPPAQEPYDRPPPNAVITGEAPKPGNKIPLYGAAVGGDDGEFELNGHILDYVFAPPSLSGIPEAYAVRVVGESMFPRYEDNDTVYVNPKRRPVRGDHVVVQIQESDDGPKLAYIKRLIRWTQNELLLEQYNPPKELHFDGRSVATVHYVLRPGE